MTYPRESTKAYSRLRDNDAEPERAETGTREPSIVRMQVLERALANMARQDWLVLGYLFLVVVAVARGDGDGRGRAVFDVTVLFVYFAAVLYAVRGDLISGERLRGLLYRFSVVGVVEATYLFFRRMLPIINARSLDRQLLGFDRAVFGIEPAVDVQRYVTPARTEWFSFVYWFYFFVISAHIIGMVWGSRRRWMLNEFTFGILFTFCVGHLCYFLVPGFGPGMAMPELFTTPFPEGFFYNLMAKTVETGGAQKDIFPSIHTAIPTFLSLWSFRHRAEKPFRYTWPWMTLFALNVIAATMYLRWHYLIDVLAGLLLATCSFAVTVRIIGPELKRREQTGLDPVWPEFRYFSKT